MRSHSSAGLGRCDHRPAACVTTRLRPQRCGASNRCSHVCSAVEFDVYKGAVPASYQQQNVVAGERTTVTPRLTPEKAFERLAENIDPLAAQHQRALYSSTLGGIVTHPAYMFIHFDDHLVQRAHGVCEDIVICEGYLYQMEEHLGRLLASAELAGLELGVSEATLRRIVLDTAAASMLMNGMVRVFLTSGRGGVGISDQDCQEPGLYVLATSEEPKIRGDRKHGWRVLPTALPPRSPYMATIGGPNLEGVVATLDAQRQGYDSAVYVDDEGARVMEGPDWSLALITQDNSWVWGPPEGVRPSITLATLAQLIPEEVDPDLPIKAVEQRPITLEDVAEALEVMAVSTTLGVMPITHLGEDPIADGTAGSMSMALHAVLENDRQPPQMGATEKHTPIPYGILTGMKTQLL